MLTLLVWMGVGLPVWANITTTPIPDVTAFEDDPAREVIVLSKN